MEQLEARRRIEDIQKVYNEVMGDNLGGFSALVKGVEGSGKTRFACTGRLPILVDVFDHRRMIRPKIQRIIMALFAYPP